MVLATVSDDLPRASEVAALEVNPKDANKERSGGEFARWLERQDGESSGHGTDASSYILPTQREREWREQASNFVYTPHHLGFGPQAVDVSKKGAKPLVRRFFLVGCQYAPIQLQASQYFNFDGVSVPHSRVVDLWVREEE